MQARIEDHIPPIDLPRNQWSVGTDSALFGIGAYFISVGTVLTSLASYLTDDKVIIGLVSLAWQAAFLLPQLLAARIIRGKARTKPYCVIPIMVLRPFLLLFPVWLLVTKAANPTLTVWLLILSLTMFMLADSLATAGWFDMLGRIFSPRIKGRVITISGLASSVGGIFVGLVVSLILGSDAISFPDNYAYVIILGNVCFTTSFLFFLRIKERPAVHVVPIENRPSANFANHIVSLVRQDPALRRMLLVRVLLAVESMAAAFYIVFARERLQLSDSAVGIFTTAIVIGGLAGTTIFGWIFGRFGSRRVINFAGTLQFLSPVLALIVSLVALPGSGLAWLGYGTLFIVMMFNGATSRSGLLGAMSYAQSLAPSTERSAYVGAINTLGGLGALMPVVGGAIIDALLGARLGSGAYTVVFAIASVAVGVGLLASLRLPHVEQLQ